MAARADQIKCEDNLHQLKVAARVDPPWADGADSARWDSIRSQGRDGENFKFQKRILTKILNNILKNIKQKNIKTNGVHSLRSQGRDGKDHLKLFWKWLFQFRPAVGCIV